MFRLETLIIIHAEKLSGGRELPSNLEEVPPTGLLIMVTRKIITAVDPVSITRERTSDRLG